MKKHTEWRACKEFVELFFYHLDIIGPEDKRKALDEIYKKAKEELS